MSLIREEELSAHARVLLHRLRADRVAFDLDNAAALDVLRRDVERIAGQMDLGERRPLMLWSGVPWPSRQPSVDRGYLLAISVGGTRTVYLLIRLKGGELVGFDPHAGREVSGAELAQLKDRCRLPTPSTRDTKDGFAMIDRIAAHIASQLGRHRDRLDLCDQVLLSWGFASQTVRTGADVLGGVTALATVMTKAQKGFTRELQGKDIGGLFRQALEKHLGWSRPVTVANDSVMSLHYFLTLENRARYGQIGLFINGTGCNFCLAEPYAVRPQSDVSGQGESYQPERVTRLRPLRAGEQERRYFVNYEIGAIDLEGTHTHFDHPAEYPIEHNALSGGNAFQQQFRELVRFFLGDRVHEELLEKWRLDPTRGEHPSGPAVTGIGGGAIAEVERWFPGADLSEPERESLHLICRAILERSALHAALILAAVSRRMRFGLGSADGKPDLLATEGSVWSAAGYPELVHHYWERLIHPAVLRADVTHEPSYNASLPGPMYLAVLHG